MKNLAFQVLACVLFVGLSASRLRAEDEFEHVEVLDHPHYSLTKRFSLDLDFTYLPLDAYYKPVLGEASISYQFTDWISWEIGRFGYSFLNYNTGLREGIRRQTSKSVNGNFDLENTKYRAGSTLFVNLLYSKSNFFNQAIVYHYWALGAGPIYYNFDQHSQTGLDIAFRVQFFVNNHYLFHIRGAHTVGFNSSAPRNITSLGGGIGVAF